MKSNNQLGMPLPFYWSPILLLPLLSPGSAAIPQLMGSRERLREKLRQNPNPNTSSTQCPSKKTTLRPKDQIPQGLEEGAMTTE